MVSKPALTFLLCLLATLVLGSVAIPDEHEVVIAKDVLSNTVLTSDRLELDERVLALEEFLENEPSLLRHENQQLQLQLKAAMDREIILRRELELSTEKLNDPLKRKNIANEFMLRTEFGDIYQLVILDKFTIEINVLSSKHLQECGGILRRQDELNAYSGEIHAVFIGDPLARTIPSECVINLDLARSRATVDCDFVQFHRSGGNIHRLRKVFDARIMDR